MYKLFLCFVCCFYLIHIDAFAIITDVGALLDVPEVSAIDNRDLDRLWAQSVEAVEKEMLKMAPDVVAQVEGESNAIKMRVYGNWLAEQAAEYTLVMAIEDMYQDSQKTGRAIMRYDGGGILVAVSSIDKDASGYYWLDRGDLDQEHCRVGDTGYYKCSYPSDFREKSLEVNINGNVIILIKHEDVVEQGQLQHVVHRLTYVAGDGDYLTATGRTYDTSKIVYDYKDYYRMQSEFDRQAQQHEKYRNMPKRELNEYYRRCFGKNASRYKQDGRCEDFYEVIMAGAYVEGAHYTLQ